MDEHRSSYEERAELYDLIYHWKDYGADAADLHDALRAEGVPDGARVLEPACGTGSYLAHLAAWYEVAGFDLSPGMLRIARSKLPDAELFVADMAEFTVPEPFDAVLCPFSSIGYVFPEERLRAAARCFAEALKPGGVLILEPWITPEDWRVGTPHLTAYDSPDLKLARANVARREGDYAILDFEWLVVRRDSGVEHFRERHLTMLYTKEQTTAALHSAGFTVRYDDTTDRGRYLARKPPA